MLGHRLMLDLPRMDYEVAGTLRSHKEIQNSTGPLYDLNATYRPDIGRALIESGADVVINCIGWVRQRSPQGYEAEAYHVNAVFPHWLAEDCQMLGIPLVHISTDCVVDRDWYGASKRLGEIDDRAIVLRTSFIGHELQRKTGLLEWMLAQTGTVDGYRRVLWNGLTTNELAQVIGRFVLPQLEKLQRFRVLDVGGSPVTKYELLGLIADCYGLRVKVKPVDFPEADHCLATFLFDREVGYVPPSWDVMLETCRKRSTDLLLVQEADLEPWK
jgi:dTDP-4-dehydrorhamnose reductase